VNIFTDAGKANVNEIFKRLDNGNTRVALEGLTIRYGCDSPSWRQAL